MEGEPREAYVSGRVGQEERTGDLIARLREAGYRVRVDWTGMDVEKPYLEHREKNAPVAEEMLRAAGKADVFVLVTAPELKGAIMETGAAMLASLDDGKQVFIVGDDRESVFYTLPSVTMCETEDEVLEHLSAEVRS